MNSAVTMESVRLNKSNVWFLTGFGLVNTVVFSFIVLSLGFILGFGLSVWQFPLALVFSMVLNYFAASHFFPNGNQKVFLRTTAIICLIIAGSIVISVFFYDISSDGQMYHMESAIQMKAGWNPFREELPLSFNQAMWLNHYGKGVEDPQATIYAVTNRLETTKSTNFIMLAASFCLAMSFLLRLNRFSFRKNLLFSSLLALNPVTFYQLLNTYVDGQLCSFILCFIAVAGLLYMDVNRYFLILLSSIMIILINIKFTALVFTAIFTAGMLMVFLISKRRLAFKRSFIVAALSAVFAVGVVGYFPYVINVVRYHDILYPGLPMLKSEALKFTPPRIRNKNQVSKFFVSFFARTDNMHVFTYNRDPIIESKIPFTFNKTDIFNASKPYVALMAGMGPFFSGIFISAVLIFGYWFWRLRDRKSTMPLIILTGTLLFSVLIISECWYVRYVPQLWFIPVILLMASEPGGGKITRRIRNFLYALMLVNISFCGVSFVYVYFKTEQIKYELEQLKVSGQTIQVEFTYYTSNRARFTEYNIPFKERPIPDSLASMMSASSTRIIRPSVMPDRPKSFVLLTGEYIVNQYHLGQ